MTFDKSRERQVIEQTVASYRRLPHFSHKYGECFQPVVLAAFGALSLKLLR